MEPDEQDVGAPEDCQGRLPCIDCNRELGSEIKLKHKQIRQYGSVQPPGLCAESGDSLYYKIK